MSTILLPPPPGRPSVPVRVRALAEWLIGTWQGRSLLAALLIWLLGIMGVARPGFLVVVEALILWGLGLFYGGRLARHTLRILLWRIRTKLLVSYLFIALVPLFLLAVFFLLASLFFSGLVAAHVLVAEMDRKLGLMQSSARSTLVDLPVSLQDGRVAEARLSACHRDLEHLRYVLFRKAQVLAQRDLPAEVPPPWLSDPSFAGLVGEVEKTGDAEDEVYSLRVMERRGDLVLVLDLPLEPSSFLALEESLGVRLLVAGGTINRKAGGVEVRIDPGRPRPPDSRLLDGWPFFAVASRTDWASGETESLPIALSFRPLTLVRRLSGADINLGDDLLRALAAVAVIFLVVYLGALAVGVLLASSITRKVHALSVGTQRLRRGDLSTNIVVRGKDQLSELAESFNLMARGIEQLMVEQAEKHRLEEELRIARQIQKSLLPEDGRVQTKGLCVSALCVPATEVGGDYYDLLPLSPTRMGLLVADVSGKGTSAALYMAELKGLILSLSRTHQSPRELLIEANRILSAHLDSRTFITMTYAIVDVEHRVMRHARAGHNPAIHFHSKTGETRVLAPAGLGLGLDRGSRFEEILEEVETPIASGDVFLFFTDGLSEAMNDKSELFGETRLRRIVEGAPGLESDDIRDRILSELRSFQGRILPHDDMTLVILKVE
jgi:serine phosphatase RsbU (regulator of sigma subunit)